MNKPQTAGDRRVGPCQNVLDRVGPCSTIVNILLNNVNIYYTLFALGRVHHFVTWLVESHQRYSDI